MQVCCYYHGVEVKCNNTWQSISKGLLLVVCQSLGCKRTATVVHYARSSYELAHSSYTESQLPSVVVSLAACSTLPLSTSLSPFGNERVNMQHAIVTVMH